MLPLPESDMSSAGNTICVNAPNSGDSNHTNAGGQPLSVCPYLLDEFLNRLRQFQTVFFELAHPPLGVVVALAELEGGEFVVE